MIQEFVISLAYFNGNCYISVHDKPGNCKENVASIKVNKTKVTLAVGKTFKLKCEIQAEDSSKKLVSHTSSYRYYSTNSKVATVSKAGVITAKGKGTCRIFVLANNGVYKKVKVKVK